LAEAAIKLTITATGCMAESGMVGKLQFKAATKGKNCLNVTYKRHIYSLPRTILKRDECVQIQAVGMSSIHASPQRLQGEGEDSAIRIAGDQP
jgi:hypothetical protein